MGRQPKSKLNLFQYLDYRKYLVDHYTLAKTSRAGFSLRSFSAKAGFGSSNFYKLVMDGDRNLSDASIEKFSKALNHTKQEQEFFRNLVLFNQASEHDIKNTYYKKLIQSQKLSTLKPIEKHQYEYYSNWYHAIVRELIQSPDFDGSTQWLAAKITPRLNENQIQKSIDLLEKLGFISRDTHGKWQQSTSVITTGTESRSVTLMNYHKCVLDLVKNQLDQIPPDYRDISALTLGVDDHTLQLIKTKIQDFRREILELVASQNSTNTVVMLTLQLLPVTKCWSEVKS